MIKKNGNHKKKNYQTYNYDYSNNYYNVYDIGDKYDDWK